MNCQVQENYCTKTVKFTYIKKRSTLLCLKFVVYPKYGGGGGGPRGHWLLRFGSQKGGGGGFSSAGGPAAFFLQQNTPPILKKGVSLGGGGGGGVVTIFTVILKQGFSFIFIHKLARVVIFYLQMKKKVCTLETKFSNECTNRQVLLTGCCIIIKCK